MKIAFDIGNVLINVDIEKFTNILDSRFNNEKPGLEFLSELQAIQDIGLSTVRMHLKNSYPALKKSEIDYLVSIWESTLTLEPAMIDFIDQLIDKKYEIFLFSNIGFEHKKHIQTLWPKLYNNTKHHLSCDVGTRKPQKLYYQSYIMQYGKPEHSFLYIDDLKENLTMANSLGLNSYYFNLKEYKEKNILKEKINLLSSAIESKRYLNFISS